MPHPKKIDTRKKTQKQKEKNRRRKKTHKLTQTKSKSLLNSLGSLGLTEGRSRRLRQSRRSRLSMKAPRGIVSNALARRMPVGTNHLRGAAARTTNGNFHSRALNMFRKVREGSTLQGRYRMPNHVEPRNPIETVHPFSLVEELPTLNTAFRVLPSASVPRGRRQNLLREAVAVPVAKSVLAEPGNPNWGQMYEITERLRPRVMRPATVAEMNKQSSWRIRNADRRTGNQTTSSLVWAPSTLRQTVQELSADEKARLTQMGKGHLIPGPEVAGYDRYDALQFARAALNPRPDFAIVELTPEEIQGLIDMGMEQPLPIPGPHIQGQERQEALDDLRSLLSTFGSNSGSQRSHGSQQSHGSQRSQQSQRSELEPNFAEAVANLDPLHLTDAEIESLNLLGPIGRGYVQDATLSADQTRVRAAIENGRLLLSQRNGLVAIETGISYNSIHPGFESDNGSRSRSGSRLSSNSWSNYVFPQQSFILSGLTGIELSNLSSFGQVGTDLIEATRVADPEAAETAREVARAFLRDHMGQSRS